MLTFAIPIFVPILPPTHQYAKIYCTKVSDWNSTHKYSIQIYLKYKILKRKKLGVENFSIVE